MLMSHRSQLDAALTRLDAALVTLEASLARRLDVDARRGDTEVELSVMQDDRARLAVDLDGALTRLQRLESTAVEVDRRVERAMGEIRNVLTRAEAV
jgi:hypothetical protein